MGRLTEYKEFKIRKLIKCILCEYGIEESDLVYLHEALEKVKNLKMEEKEHYELSKEQKEQIEKQQKEKITPEQLVKQFSSEIEEFKINGKRKATNY